MKELMRTMTVKFHEKFYFMCYDLYNKTPAKNLYEWDEFITMICEYGIDNVDHMLTGIQCKDIYDVVKHWGIDDFLPAEFMMDEYKENGIYVKTKNEEKK